jgi:hypothetical protein
MATPGPSTGLVCPTCNQRYKDIQDHIRKRHPSAQYTRLQLQPLGLTPCDICHAAFKNTDGVKAHKAKVHQTPGTSTISTPRRTHTDVKGIPIDLSEPRRGRPIDIPEIDNKVIPETPRKLTNSPPWPPSPSHQIRGYSDTPSPIIEPSLPRLSSFSPAISPILPRLQSPPKTIKRERPLSPLRHIKRERESASPEIRPHRRRRYTSPSAISTPSPATLEALGIASDAVEPDIVDLCTPSPPLPPNTSSQLLPTPLPRAIELLDEPDSPIISPKKLEALPDPPKPPYIQSKEAKALEEAHQSAVDTLLNSHQLNTLLAYSRAPIIEKQLHHRQAKLFREAAKRASIAYIERPTENNLLDFLILPRVLGLGLAKNKLAETLQAFPGTLPTPPPIPPPPVNDNIDPLSQKPFDPIRQSIRHLEKGHLGKASKAIYDSTPLATLSLEVKDTLRAKNPIGAPDPFKRRNRYHPATAGHITEAHIIESIKSINIEKAEGLSGWTRPLLDQAIKEPAVLACLRLLTDMIRQGTAPGANLLTASRLIPLTKPNGGIRPIAIGDLIYKVAAKAILNCLYKPDMLLPCQLGVRTPGGVEPAIILLREAIENNDNGTPDFSSITALDYTNAYNAIGRSSIAGATATYAPTLYRAAMWAYGGPSILVLPNSTYIANTEGVRQGDPLAPLLFSIAVRPTLETIQERLPRATIVSYLDDTIILNKDTIQDPKKRNIWSKETLNWDLPTPTLDTVQQVLESSPLTLNTSKSTEYRVARLRETGLNTLGTYIGPQYGRKRFLRSKRATLETILKRLEGLPKQYALLLLRGSIQHLLRHLLRTLNPAGLKEEWSQIDKAIQGFIALLATRDPSEPLNKDIKWDLITLPIRDGGLGVIQHADVAEYTVYAAAINAYDTIRAIYPRYRGLGSPPPPPAENDENEIQEWYKNRIRQTPIGLKESLGATTTHQVLIALNKSRIKKLDETLGPLAANSRVENASYLGRKWLGVLPTQNNRIFADSETTEALRSRLLIPIIGPANIADQTTNQIPLNKACGACGALADIGHQDICRAAERRYIARHDNIQKSIIWALRSKTALEAQSEASVDSTTKRPDFSCLIGPSRYYYDVQVVGIGKNSARSTPWETLKEAYDEKLRKYRSLGTYIKPLIFSAGGLLAKESAQSYKQIQSLVGPFIANEMDIAIGVTLAKSRAISAASVANKLPSSGLYTLRDPQLRPRAKTPRARSTSRRRAYRA